jgi:2-dehydropantoate 2-reductase
MRFHILGIGPIGSLLAFNLRRNIPPTHVVTLIHKTQRQANEFAENSGEIRVELSGVTSSENRFEGEVFEAYHDREFVQTRKSGQNPGTGSDPPKRAPGPSETAIQSLFVTTKAHQTIGAIRRLLHRLSGDSTIVLLQNGMGIYEQLIHDVFRNPAQRPHFILASNTHGAWFKRFHHVVHAGFGEIHFGIVPDTDGRQFEAGSFDSSVAKSDRRLDLNDITNASDDPLHTRYKSLRSTVSALCDVEKGLRTSWRPIAQVQERMLQKLVVNSVINPLTAIIGCRNGDIFGTTASHRIMRRVCQEAADVIAAQIRADTLNGDNPHTSARRIPRSLTAQFLEEECVRVAELTRGNISSTLNDIRRGRTTEIDFLNGYLLNLGATYGVPMPATATLLNLVKMRARIPIDQQL